MSTLVEQKTQYQLQFMMMMMRRSCCDVDVQPIEAAHRELLVTAESLALYVSLRTVCRNNVIAVVQGACHFRCRSCIVGEHDAW